MGEVAPDVAYRGLTAKQKELLADIAVSKEGGLFLGGRYMQTGNSLVKRHFLFRGPHRWYGITETGRSVLPGDAIRQALERKSDDG